MRQDELYFSLCKMQVCILQSGLSLFRCHFARPVETLFRHRNVKSPTGQQGTSVNARWFNSFGTGMKWRIGGEKACGVTLLNSGMTTGMVNAKEKALFSISTSLSRRKSMIAAKTHHFLNPGDSFEPPSPLACCVAVCIHRAIVLLTLPSSRVSKPAIVHPPGVVTLSLIAAGCDPLCKTIRAAPCIAENEWSY